MKTFFAKLKDIDKKWYVIDAENAVPGRLAAMIASRIRGKNLPTFTPHMDCGDNIIVINASKIKFTGNKQQDKNYYWHTGYPGGIKQRKAKEIINGKFPQRIVYKAVKRMMPGGPLSRKQLKNLYIYPDAQHPHQAQKAEVIDIEKINRKNIAKGK